MPYGGDFDEYYLQIYKPAVEAVGLKPLRADDLYTPSTIIGDIWEMINSSKMMIAELTTLNANVMYELGLAHAVAKPVILISDSIDTIPFDLRGLRILTYNKNKPNWGVQLCEDIKKSITDTIDAPLESILPAFLKILPTKALEVSEITNDLLEIKQLLTQQINNSGRDNKNHNVRTLKYIELYDAIKECKKLYYDDGLEIPIIKQRLMDTYNVSYQMANTIFEKALW